MDPDPDPNSGSVPERFFKKVNLGKKSADDNKSMKNYPACKEATQFENVVCCFFK